MKSTYKEVILSELIDDRAKAFYKDLASQVFPFPTVNGSNGGFNFGVTLADKDGKPVRLRVYSDSEHREKARPFVLVIDALKGADIPVSEVEATLTQFIPNLKAEDSKVILDDVRSAERAEGRHRS
jgi:hypothetical protein